MDFDPANIASVTCDHNYDPPMIVIVLLDMSSFSVPYSFYSWISGPLGLPDVIC